MKTILVTGVCGFIFSNFIKYVVNQSYGFRWIGVDKLVRKHNIDNMFNYPGYKFYLADISDAHAMDRIFEIEKPDIVIGGAAESFVDNSITDIMPFLQSNVIGTQVLINSCLKYNVSKYMHISTDEVFGQKLSINDFPWTENSPLAARNPYAASKAAAELIVTSAHETHGLQYQITRSCNVFGPSQKHDNLIPHIINSLLNNQFVNIHGSGENFRQYIYVLDKITAIMAILEKGNINSIYNIGDYNYRSNLDMVKEISNLMKIEPMINHIADRKAHDFGYSVSNAKLQSIGWRPKYDFNYALQQTINYYVKNK